MFAVAQDMLTIHEDMDHAGGELMWLLEGRVILDLLGIEYNHVREVTRGQETPSLYLKIASR